jgi:hypothetical protein
MREGKCHLALIDILGVTRMENDLLFCSKLMFTNGKIVVCKYII